MSAGEFYNIVSGIGDSYTAGLARYKKDQEDEAAKQVLGQYFDATNGAQPLSLAALGRNLPAAQATAQPAAGGGGLASLGKLMTPPPEIKAIIDKNVPEADRPYYYQLAGKESSFNPAAVSPTGASGLLQFTRGTGRDYGLVGPNGDRRSEAEPNIQAGVRLTEDNRAGLTQALGRAPTYSELAMAHQQGLQGAISLITGKGNIPANNLRVNNIDPNAPREQQAAKVAGFYGFGDQAPPQVAQPPQQAMPASATAYAPTAPAGQHVLGGVDVGPGATPGSVQWGQAGPGASAQPAPPQQQPPQSLAALGQQAPAATAPAPSQMAQAAPQQAQQRFSPEESAALRQMIANPQTRGQAMAIIQSKTGVKIPQWEKLNDGTLFDKNSGNTRSATGGPAYRPLTDPAERLRYGIPADDKKPYQLDPAGKLSAVGANGTTVNVDTKGDNKFAEVASTSIAKRFEGIVSEGDSAQADKALLGQLQDLGSVIGTGGAAGIQKWLSDRGIKVGDNVGALEAYGAIIDKLTPQQRIPGSGATSDYEGKMFKNSLPSLMNTPQGNAILSGTLQALADNKIARAAIAEQGLNREITPQETTKQLRALPSPYEAFVKFKKGQPADAAAPAPAASSAPAAGRQAPAAAPSAPVRVQSPDEARRLPKGTPIILPDGRQGVVP